MMDTSSVRQAVRKIVPPAMVTGVRRWRQRRSRTSGLPSWCNDETVRQIVEDAFGETNFHASHVDMSGYKQQSAAKIWIRAQGGRRMTLVTKRTRGANSGYPAIEGFPGPVGAPERFLYGEGPGELKSWVPRLYASEDLGENEVHYYFEDLFETHRKVTGPDDRIRLAALLIELQEPLQEWLNTAPTGSVLRYDSPFPEDFMTYAHGALDAFATASGDSAAIRFMKQWESTAQVYLALDPGKPAHGVHGDYRSDNLFLHRRDEDKFKAVDWEYSGWGWMHNDLASLFKAAGPELYERALGLLIERRPEFSASEHRELFHRCRLERAILDAALVAKQRMATSANPRVNADHFDLAYSALDALSATPK